MNKIEKPLAKLKKRKKEKTQITKKSRDETGDNSMDLKNKKDYK